MKKIQLRSKWNTYFDSITKLTYVNNSNVLAAGNIFFDNRLRLFPFGAVDVVITELVPLPFVMIFSLFVPPIGSDVSL